MALLLRSAEAQPYLPRFVWFFQTFFLFLLLASVRSYGRTKHRVGGPGLGNYLAKTKSTHTRARHTKNRFGKDKDRKDLVLENG